VALIRQSLREHGIGLDVVVMSDGEKAVEFLDNLDNGTDPCPALIILDLNLPRTTGREVLQRVRASSRCGKTPVAIFSSSDAAKDREETARLGANRYIRKPSNLDEFLGLGSVLKELLKERDD
jgi:DNA-binding response OmpR family regulator